MNGIFSFILILANVIVSYQGFRNQVFMDKYKFEVEAVLIYRDYKRLLTAGFLHVGWMHLLFNMFTLYICSGLVEMYLGDLSFLIVYFSGLIGGNLLALFIHKNHSDYSSVGASGAICSLIFAGIALYPDFRIGLFFIPISIPGWLFGIIYVGYSMYAIRSGKNNVGHEAHLGGALIGLAIAVLLHPSALLENYITILLIAVPCIVFIYLIITRPAFLLVDNLFFKRHHPKYNIDQRYNADKKLRQEKIDAILDKIGKKGMGSLTRRERADLEEHSRKF